MNWTRVSDSHLELVAALFFQTQKQELVTYILNLCGLRFLKHSLTLGHAQLRADPGLATCCLLQSRPETGLFLGREWTWPPLRTSQTGDGSGEEGAPLSGWMARSQPGSFIEIFLNNLHVLVLCVSNAVSSSVIPMGRRTQGVR